MVNKSWTHAAKMFFIVFFLTWKHTFGHKKSIFLSGREDITKIWFDVGTQRPFRKVTFFILRSVFKRVNQFKERYIYETLPKHILCFMSHRRFGLGIFGIPLAVILYLVIKVMDHCCWNVFYLICGPLNISSVTTSVFI